MNSFTLAIAVGCLILAIFLIAAFLKTLGGLIFSWLGAYQNKSTERHRDKVLTLCDDLLMKGNAKAAVIEIRKGFIFDETSNKNQTADSGHSYYLSLLSRLVTAADQLGGRLNNLPLIEGLLISRHELAHAYYQTKMASPGIYQKAEKSGRSWAAKELDQKINDVKDRLDVNKRTLESQLDETVTQILKDSSGEQIQVH